MQKNSFIFVVCGAKEHIDTLHYSLQYLKKYSKNEIWILTDSTRNEVAILHDKIIDVATPTEFDHHQASIFLKTGIYKYFPKGNRYCYLDTDILALSEDVDKIFDEYIAPIRFAPDHSTMEQFSAYALNCECLKQYESYRNKLEDELAKVDPLRRSQNDEIRNLRNQLITYYQQNKSISKRILLAIQFFLSIKTFHLTNKLIYDKRKKVWKDKESGTVFMNKINMAKSTRKVGLKWNYFTSYPMLPDRRSLWRNDCYHLPEAIKNKFGVTVSNPQFQHWNGGVFLFDDQSHEFLETWLHSTLEIFNEPYWKTRDQGTLIKTVWEFGLQNHPTLNKKWNLIADYYNPSLKWEGKEIVLKATERYTPVLLHVYHHFGDEEWGFWNQIPKI